MKNKINRLALFLLCFTLGVPAAYSLDNESNSGEFLNDEDSPNELPEIVCSPDNDDDDDWGWWRNDNSDDDLAYNDKDDEDPDDDTDRENNNNNNDMKNDNKTDFPVSKDISPKQGCAVWCVKQILEALRKAYTKEQIIDLVANALGWKSEVVSIYLDYQGLSNDQINQIYNYFFDYHSTKDINERHAAIDEGKYVIAIMQLEGSAEDHGHDVVILDYNKNEDGTYTYTCYDPQSNSILTGSSDYFYINSYIINDKKTLK